MDSDKKHHGKKHHGTGNFVPGSVRIIDYDTANNNLLVRGSSAFGAENFTMAALVTAIKADKYYASTGISLADTPMIIDFCLVGFGPPNHKDKRIVEDEAKWFNATNPPVLNGSSGPYPVLVPATSGNHLMVYWPILSIGGTVPTAAGGSWSGAHAVDVSIQATNNGFNYSGLVPAIHNALSNNPSKISGFPETPIKNAVIYVHCDSGINRTGAAIIGYLMQYGSNISDLGIPALPDSPYHSLQAAQKAAGIYPPVGDSPTGGVDQAVPEAYCNLINTKSVTGPLSQNCVPRPGSVN